MKAQPQAIRDEIEARFDDVLSSETGIILYRIAASRAAYLLGWARNIKDEAALQSTQMYDPTDPLYAKGMYWAVHFKLVPPGILFERKAEIELTDAQLLINAAYLGQEVILQRASERDAAKYVPQLLAKRNVIRRREGEGYEALYSLLIFAEEDRVIIRSPTHPTEAVEELSPDQVESLMHGDGDMSSGHYLSQDRDAHPEPEPEPDPETTYHWPILKEKGKIP